MGRKQRDTNQNPMGWMRTAPEEQSHKFKTTKSQPQPENKMSAPSAPDEAVLELPPPRSAPTFAVDKWDVNDEPSGMTKLLSGESFVQGVRRVAEKINDTDVVSKGCSTIFPGMKVSGDQVVRNLCWSAHRPRRSRCILSSNRVSF